MTHLNNKRTGNRFQPNMETLEERLVKDASISFDDGILTITGDSYRDIAHIYVQDEEVVVDLWSAEQPDAEINRRIKDDQENVEYQNYDRDLEDVETIVFRGLDGNDNLWSNAPVNMKAYGGRGHDYMITGSGRDYLQGDSGNDYLNAGDNRDTLSGGHGHDLLFGDSSIGDLYTYWNDRLDTYYSFPAINEEVNAPNFDRYIRDKIGAGTPSYRSDFLNEFELSERGQTGFVDHIYGGYGNDIAYGAGGDDRIYGQAGSDWLFGGTEDDRIEGGYDFDFIYGGSGRDQLHAVGSSLRSRDGEDRAHIYGGSQNDYLYGSDGCDRLYGEAGVDYLYGRGEKDLLAGGTGSDHLYGEDGSDYLYGGSWYNIDDGVRDYLYGGRDKDVLYLFSPDVLGDDIGDDIIHIP